jgi:hypothetical protein
MFIKSECKKFLCFRLTHPRDKKEVKDFTNCPESELPPYHFWFYDSNTGKGEIKKPVFDVRYEENDFVTIAAIAMFTLVIAGTVERKMREKQQ